MKSLVHTEELCSRSVPLEHAPGAKSLVCIGLKEDVKQISTANTDHNIFLLIFAGKARLEKGSPTFSRLNPSLSLPSVAKTTGKSFHT